MTTCSHPSLYRCKKGNWICDFCGDVVNPVREEV